MSSFKEDSDYTKAVEFLNSMKVSFRSIPMKPNHRMIKCDEIGYTGIFNKETGNLIGRLFESNSIV